MIKFLLQRPIAVLMAFTACFIIGLVTYGALPVSLLPDIPIPEITVQVAAENTSARELENTIIKPLRGELTQVSTLKDLHSESRDEGGLIRLSFEHGVDIDLAFIEVNEKIDAAMNHLPKDVKRPKVVKASATDIPILYLHLTLKESGSLNEGEQTKFLELCSFAESIVKRRIEQLPEVAMVDITGLRDRQVQIIPDESKLATLRLSVTDINDALNANNVEPGSMMIRNGHYEYNIRFSTLLRTVEDVKNIYLRKSGRIVQLKDFCHISVIPIPDKGLSVSNGKRAITLAVIKQADASMDQMKRSLTGTIKNLQSLNSEIEFSVSRNQSDLLDYTITNLQQNLILGFLFVCLIAFLFIGDVKSPLVIGLSMIASIVISFVFFYLCNVSLNIISLAGLILALGMMIDNSIIVTENISQYRERGYSLQRASVAGTSEVISPMLSASLTTIAVFAPLIFMSGIAGAIFFDQAFSVTVGLMVSYFTGIILLPVLYLLIYRMGILFNKKRKSSPRSILVIKESYLDKLYDSGIHWVFSHKWLCTSLCAITIPLCILLFGVVDKQRMPDIHQSELITRIDWNENIHIAENQQRVEKLLELTSLKYEEQTTGIGRQDFILNRDRELTSSEAELYFRTVTPEEIPPMQEQLLSLISLHYPNAIVTFSPPETIFEKLFRTNESTIVAQVQLHNRTNYAEDIRQLEQDIRSTTSGTPMGVAFENQLNISFNIEKILLYGVSYNELHQILRTAFRNNSATQLHSFHEYLPINIMGNEKTVDHIVRQTLVQTQPDNTGNTSFIPLSELISITPSEDIKCITADRNGEFIPFSFHNIENEEETMKNIVLIINSQPNRDVHFTGSFFSNQTMMNELLIVLLISLVLVYFILVAQFESFLQPLLVLVEIPIDIAFAIALLWITGHTLNLMSAIGLIVACGIVINDSILKLDAINELRKKGIPLLSAIHQAGKRRLRPIIMTSLTTIGAMIPLLFSSDLGSEMQKPLSIAMIGTMSIGTLVSLYIIPLFYWFIYRAKGEKVPTNN